jgi:hypothetical protein
MRWISVAIFTQALLLPFAVAFAAEPDSTHADEQVLKAAKIGVDGASLLDYFRKQTVTDAARERIQTLIQQLGDDSFEMREKASAGLVAAGGSAKKFLREALDNPDLEVSRRAHECLKRISETGTDSAVPAAAARLLAARKPAGAVEVLLGYLTSADGTMGTDEVRTTLAALALRDGQPDKALLAALTGKLPVIRAAAGEALARSGGAAARPAVHKLLQDAEASVRLPVALALAYAHDREAIPVLIELLAKLPPEQAWAAEDLLFRLAAERAPAVSLGTDVASRQKCHDAWAAWWRDQGARVDLSKLDDAPRPLGYTVVVLLDLGLIEEVDASKQPRWQFTGLEAPLDVQLLPGDRLLVAEHGGNRVTERNHKGEVLWEVKVAEPLVAQRLPNGNTFVATRTQFLEYNRAGKQVASHRLPDGEMLMRAQKLRNGEIACVTTDALNTRRFVRLSPTGKELGGFAVNVQTFGGRIDVLPNGHVLVPQMADGRVVEYNADGKPVWEAAVAQPIAAVRLANGHTLITSMSDKRAVELDRTGKEVWEYRSGTRVTRALRR